MADINYNNGLFRIWDRTINLSTASVNIILLTSAGVTTMTNKDLISRADLSGEIASATGYTAASVGVTSSVAGAGTTVTKDDVNDRVNTVFAARTISATTITAAGALYFVTLGGASSADLLLCLNDFDGNIVSTGGDFVIPAMTMRLQN